LQGEREMASDNRILGNFKLEGIRQAPRGLPQIEVTFDVDANGILNVTAKDRDTGKQQQITIESSTNLDKSEVERMIREAQEHSDDDRKKKERAEARNELESSVYQLEKMVNETAVNAPENEKARARSLVEEGKAALADSNVPVEKLKSASSDVKQMLSMLSSSAGPQGTPGPENAESAPGGAADDNVVDAEFVDNENQG
ncbi:MAG: Hsp70 family protein, partial [Synergistaceae bacterium]|nr:Hsp70 family protein [Synergistaceae bacterium]